MANINTVEADVFQHGDVIVDATGEAAFIEEGVFSGELYVRPQRSGYLLSNVKLEYPVVIAVRHGNPFDQVVVEESVRTYYVTNDV